MNEICPHTGRTPLLDAISANNDFLACQLIESGANINHIDSWGTNAICRASQRGLTRVVGKLINKGANVNSRTFKTGFTPLHEAAAAGHQDVVILLLRHGANPKAKCNSENPGAELGPATPSDLAIMHGHFEVYKILQQAEETPAPH